MSECSKLQQQGKGPSFKNHSCEDISAAVPGRVDADEAFFVSDKKMNSFYNYSISLRYKANTYTSIYIY